MVEAVGAAAISQRKYSCAGRALQQVSRNPPHSQLDTLQGARWEDAGAVGRGGAVRHELLLLVSDGLVSSGCAPELEQSEKSKKWSGTRHGEVKTEVVEGAFACVEDVEHGACHSRRNRRCC